MITKLVDLIEISGLYQLSLQHVGMIIIAGILMYLAIVKEFEPLLLLPISFGVLLVNIPRTGLMSGPTQNTVGGLLHYLYEGVRLGIYPPLIFLGIGAMTDFGPLIAHPKTMLLGAAAQFGIFTTFFGATMLGFNLKEAGSTAIIGGADGPTSIYLTSRLAPELLAVIAIAAYIYIAMVPLIQPPIIKALTSKKERAVEMEQLRPVSKKEKIIFPVMVTVVVGLIVPQALSLVGMLMLGNILRECGVTKRLSDTASNALVNTVTILLMLSVGASLEADVFFDWKFLGVLVLGLSAFAISTIAGLLMGKIMAKFSKEDVNPMIGSAGVSAVPEAARCAQRLGQEANSKNFLLMHAMAPNVAGVIGSAVAAGVLLSILG
mgnify:FL=1